MDVKEQIWLKIKLFVNVTVYKISLAFAKANMPAKQGILKW